MCPTASFSLDHCPLNHPHPPNPFPQFSPQSIFLLSTDLTFGVTDAPQIRGLEELENQATEGRPVHRLLQPPHILLFIEPERLQSPQFSLSEKSPSSRAAR